MSMRTYRPMRLAPTTDPLLRNDLQGVDTWLRQLSTQQARIPVAPQGTPSAGSSTVDLSKYLFLPGRAPEQDANGTVVFKGKSQAEANVLNDSVYRGLVIQGDFIVGGQALTHKVYFQPEYVSGISIVRKWIFPSISGSATDTFTFVTTSGSQTIDGKSITGGTIYVGTATGANTFHDADSSGGTREFKIGFNTGFPTIGVSTPTLRLPPLSTVSDLHTFAIVHAASASPFPPGSIIYGNAAGTEFDALANGSAGNVLVSGGGTAAPSWTSPSGLAVEHSSTTDRDVFTVNCTTNGTTAVTSAALFGSVQVGHVIYGTGIPAGTTVTIVTDASNIVISQAATDSTTNVRNFASDDHTQVIRKFGPTNQFIGVQPGGTVPAGGLHMSGFLSVGSTVPVSTTETVHIEKIVTGVLTNYALFKMTHGGTGSVGSTHTTLLVQNAGAASRSAGSPSFTGIDVQITPNVPSGLGDNIVLGINMSAVSTMGGGATVAEVTGVNAETGASGGTATLMRAAAYTLRPGSATVGTIRAIELLSSSTTLQTATVTNMFGMYFDSLATAATISGAGAITNLYHFYRSTAVSGAVTNAWFIYLDADIKSAHRGKVLIGSVSTGFTDQALEVVGIIEARNAASPRFRGDFNPTGTDLVIFAFDDTGAVELPVSLGLNRYVVMDNPNGANLRIVAGTTAAAPLRLTSGTNVTTPVAGNIEFTTDDFFATITTGTARKAFILDDGTRLTSGRVPFATTNGRLVDDADMTFATDTLTVTKIAATTLTGTLTFADAINVVFNGTTGTKLGTATSQKLGFWNAAPIVQPTTAIAAATFVANTSGIANDTATWDGYTIGQVVKALRNMGALA